MKDFWAEPSYAELLLDMQKRVHDYVVADKGTAQEALDLLVKDWTKVFKEAGQAGSLRVASDPISPEQLPRSHASGETARAPSTAMTTITHPTHASAEREPSPGRRSPSGACGARGLSDRAIAWLFITPTIAAAARDQHLSADLDDPALVHQLQRQHVRTLPLRFVGLDNYQRHPDRSRTSGTRMQATAHFVLWSIVLAGAHRLWPRAADQPPASAATASGPRSSCCR